MLKHAQTSWVDFTNILQAAFTHTYHKSAKRLSSHECLFPLMGSVCSKAARKTLAKLTLSRHVRE